MWSFRVEVAPGSVELRPRRFQEVKGSLELQNPGLRALEEAWDDSLLEALFCQVWSFSALLGRLKVVPRCFPGGSRTWGEAHSSRTVA